jgi:phage terminase small subunit
MTPKQVAFIGEYLKDLNGTQAAIRAGYSAKTANEQASRLLTDVNIAAAVAEAKAKRAEECGIDAAWVLKEAKRTYEACHAADKLSEAVSALKLVGTHIDVQAFKERMAQEHSMSKETAEWLGLMS